MKTTDEMIKSVFARKQSYEEAKKTRRLMLTRGVTIACSMCLVLTLLVVGGMQTKNAKSQENYRILIDVNPSIALCANEKDVVIEAKALNSDGEKILKEADTEGRPVNEAVKDLSETMTDLGYISEEANSILVSVEGLEGKRDQNIKENIAESISESLTDKNIEGSIILQTVPGDSELNQAAETYGISVGKAQLISQIIAQNKLLTFQELSAMSIHELNVLKVSYYIEAENTYEVGTPGYMAYIGQNRANEIALTDANVTANTMETRLDCHAGMIIYCVEFENDTHEYRYRVNAVTGEILSGEKSELGKNDFFVGETDAGFVGENAALDAALAHAGLKDSVLIRCKYNRDWVDGISVYNLYFTDGLVSGRYVVNARTGEIIQNSLMQEPKDRRVTANVIGEATAKRIALAKDGLIDGNVSKYEIKLVAANGTYTYELMFICNGVRYNVQLDAMDGTVLTFEKTVLRDTGSPSAEDGSHVSSESGNSSEK